MAIPIRSIPVLEGEVARQFVKEAKENEKKRGTYKFSEDSKASFSEILEKARKNGTLPL
jgi:hypothetical protein